MTRPGPTTCAECPRPITQDHRGKPRLYCCNRCKDRASWRRRKAARPKPPPPQVSCSGCGGPVPPRKGGGMPRLHCSDACRLRARRARLLRLNPPRTRCAHCGGKMKPGIASKRFCNLACRKRAARARQQPPKHDVSRYAPDEAAAIEAALKAGKVTRIENGSWPDPDREGVGQQWRKRRWAA